MQFERIIGILFGDVTLLFNKYIKIKTTKIASF